MMKILHSADWHLDAPIQGRTAEQTRLLKENMLQLPRKIAQICREQGCRLMLLSGDIFDGPYSAESLQAVQQSLASVEVPVFIAPGNHDFVGNDSPWLLESWPENVHIFTKDSLQCVEMPQLGLRVWGAGFTAMDCPALLEGFHSQGDLMVLHGDPTQANSSYCPITRRQIEESGLQYLALGHIHKTGAVQAGQTLCAWPGCPMGKGYDEPGSKGVLVVTLDQSVRTEFIPLDCPKFFDLQLAPQQLDSALPAVGNEDFYRITLVGESQSVDLNALQREYAHFPNLELRDQTVLPVDPWVSAGEDSFEGTYFAMLKNMLEDADEVTRERVMLAAAISRKILDGQEVILP